VAIGRDEVIPSLLAAAPGFQAAWQEYLKSWDREDRGIYTDAGEFAHYVVRSYADGNTAEFNAIFTTLETILREGDDTARDAATIGVLEDIQTIASNRPFGAAAFEGWLGPLSRQAWEEIDRLWRAGGGSLAGVIRLESRLRSKGARPWWRFWNRDSV
jgi:hypothetical protein